MDLQWRHIPIARFRSRSLDSIGRKSDTAQNGFVVPPVDFIIPHKYSAEVPDYSQVPTFPERPCFEHDQFSINPRTLVVTFDGCPNDPYHPASMPIYQTATFVQPSVNEFGPYDYTRSGNPTRTALETILAKLEGAHAAFAFTSGMSALTTLVHLLHAGDEVIACSDLYGGMHRLLTQICSMQGIKVKFVDTTNLSKLEMEMSANVALVHIETPSNPLMRITDLRKVSKLCVKYNALLSIDSTMMSPILMHPLKLGADIVMHSATKFISGHSDTMAGILCVKSEDLSKRVAFLQNAEGTALAPFDCWLLLRGLKTMAIRVERAQENTKHVVNFLKNNRRVQSLHYSGQHNSGDKNAILQTSQLAYELQMSQAKGGGSVLSFETGDVRFSQRIVNSCRLFHITVSFGSCNSLIEMPCLLSHASIPAEKRTLPPDLIRLSVGIEDVHDIVEDLARAFRCALSDVEDVRSIENEPPTPLVSDIRVGTTPANAANVVVEQEIDFEQQSNAAADSPSRRLSDDDFDDDIKKSSSASDNTPYLSPQLSDDH